MEKSSAKSIQCVVVTPERAVLDEAADFVAVPMYDGELGVLPGRSPMIGRLGIGELRIRTGSATKHFLIDGGFVQVRGQTVTVLTSRAQAGQELTAASADEALAGTRSLPSLTEEEHATKVKAQRRARAQRRIIERMSRPGITLS